MGDGLRTTLSHDISLVVFFFSAYWKLELHLNNRRLGNAFLQALAEEGMKAVCSIPDLWFTWTSYTLQPDPSLRMF